MYFFVSDFVYCIVVNNNTTNKNTNNLPCLELCPHHFSAGTCPIEKKIENMQNIIKKRRHE